jgi:hypothetical protein
MTLEVYGMYVYLRSDRDDRKNLQKQANGSLR